MLPKESMQQTTHYTRDKGLHKNGLDVGIKSMVNYTWIVAIHQYPAKQTWQKRTRREHLFQDPFPHL